MIALETPALDPRRRQNIGASESPALFSLPWGVEFGEDRFKPFETRFHLWQRKAGVLPDVDFDSKRMFWGRKLESGIAAGIAELTGWNLERASFVTHPKVRGMSATPDFGASISWGDSIVRADVEVKNVDRGERQEWPRRVEPGVFVWDRGQWEPSEVQPPFRIKLQVQHQQACTTNPLGVIVALVGGNNEEIYAFERHPGVIARIEREVKEFWRSIDANEPPAPDWMLDAATIAALHGFSTPGKLIDLRGDALALDLARAYDLARSEEKAAEGRKDAAKAQLLTIINDAEKALLDDGFSISAKEVKEAIVPEYLRSAYRGFRLNQKKQFNRG